MTIMKRLFNYIAAVAFIVPVLLVGCTPDYTTPDQGQLPSAQDFNVTIQVDQETNYVTFTLNNPGMVPMFIFGDEKVDGKANKTYAYTGNGLSLRFRDAGVHTVEVKAYNAHGISVGSKVYEFTLENTYRDPFDATPYMTALANEWQWDSATDGHFGCGSIVAETGQANPDNPGVDWWKCGPNGKDGMGLYDDKLTFTAAGEFTFDPGEGGTTYVNWGVAASGLYPGNYNNDEQDYQAPVESFTCSYSIESNWNDAGIQELYLVLEEGHNLSYIPHLTAINEPRYRFLETNIANIRKTLSLVNEAPTENGGGGIAWKYQFTPAVQVLGPEEMLAGTTGAGKVWVMDSEAQGHLGCGDSVDNAAGWWSAPPGDKAAFGLYDDEITFYPDGKYVYNPGADGKMFINWGVTAIGPNLGVEPDIDIDWTLTESTYEFDGSTITLAPNTPMVYVPSDYVWENPVFHVKSITETQMVVVADNPGCYWQMIFKARDIEAPNPDIPESLDPSAAGNLWKGGYEVTYWFANNDWAQIANPDVEVDGTTYRITIPEGMGSSRWQGQMAILTDINLEEGKKYDFQVKLYSETDQGQVITIKLCNGLEGSNDDPFFFDPMVGITSYETTTYINYGFDGKVVTPAKLVLDFGGCAIGSVIEVSDFVLQEHVE